jgi:Protein of unknown function (DUF3489)
MPSKSTSKNKKPNITKLELIANHLSRSNGASIPELVKTSGWQAHSIRGFMSGTLKKRGLAVVNTKQESKDRRYMLKESA